MGTASSCDLKMLHLREESEEVLYVEGDFATVGAEEIAELKRRAAGNRRRRCRICAHSTPNAPLHEMLIVHERDAWVPPHKHLYKDESIHVVEGSAVLVTFAEEGRVIKSVRLSKDKKFYCRVPADTYHTLLIESDWFVFHETTTGPFDRTATVFASWAPAIEGEASALFNAELRTKILL
jgi:cupin fold WbuC family metalloprotein